MLPPAAALPPRLRDGLEALDPSHQDLSGLKAEVLLIHGKDDPFIPAVESQKLAKTLGEKADLYVLEEVTHVEVNKPSSWWDKVEMLFAGRKLLSFRD